MTTISTEAVVAQIDQWFQEKIRRGDIARHTPALNQATEAVEDLKARLVKAFATTEKEVETGAEQVTGKLAAPIAAPTKPAGEPAATQE